MYLLILFFNLMLKTVITNLFTHRYTFARVFIFKFGCNENEIIRSRIYTIFFNTQLLWHFLNNLVNDVSKNTARLTKSLSLTLKYHADISNLHSLNKITPHNLYDVVYQDNSMIFTLDFWISSVFIEISQLDPRIPLKSD